MCRHACVRLKSSCGGGETGTEVTDTFRLFAATEHSKELGKYARFQIHVESCSGLDNAFQVGIYVAGNHNPHGVSIQPFECNVHVHE